MNMNPEHKYLKFSSEMFPNAMELFYSYTAQSFPEVNFDG